jgi:hypothetical protein
VYIYKKAFFLLFALYQRLDPRSPVAGSDKSAQRTVPSAHALPMFIDNVLCTMLVHLGIVDLSSCTVETLSRWNTSANEFRSSVKDKTQEELDGIPKHVDGPRVTAQEAYTVRAAALDAGKVILERVREIEGREGYGWLGTVDEADIGKFSTTTASLKFVYSGRLIIILLRIHRWIPMGRGQGRSGIEKSPADGGAEHDHVLRTIYQDEY